MAYGIIYRKNNYLAVIILLFILSPMLSVRAQSSIAYFPSLTGMAGFPDYVLNTGFIGGTAGNVSAYVELKIAFAGNLATVRIGGVGQLSGATASKELTFIGTGGSASMDFGPSATIKYNITVPKATAPFTNTFVGNNDIDLVVQDTKNFTTLLLDTVVELSDSLPDLPIGTASINIGSTTAGTPINANFDLTMSEDLKNTVSGTLLSTGLGSIASENDSIPVTVNGSSLFVSGIKESLKSKLTLSVGIGGKIGISVGATNYSVTVPAVKFPVNIGTISFTTNPLAGMTFSGITGVTGRESPVPGSYMLDQNYPNPFNPTTTIGYSIPKASLVVLKVFNVLGQNVNTLVDKFESPGNYAVRFNGSGLPSGLYFYRLQAGNFISTKKLVVMK